MALSIRLRRLAFLVTLVTFALARQAESSLRRRTIVRGSTHAQYSTRNLGVGHDDGDGGDKHGKSKGRNKSVKSPKSGGNTKHKGDNDDEEEEESHSDPEELPSADDSGIDDSEHKGGPGDKGSHKDKGGDKKAEKGRGKENGSENFQYGEYKQWSEHQISNKKMNSQYRFLLSYSFRPTENVETIRKNVPDFAISYVIDSSRRSETLQEADYNELSVVSEEFLDRMFRSVFEDLAVEHHDTAAYALIDEDTPFLVSFRVTLDFVVPGEIPTVQFLIDRVQESFEEDASRTTYLLDLSTMSETNPFSATTSFSLITGSGNTSNGIVGRPGGSNQPPMVFTDNGVMSKKTVMVTSLSCIGFLILLLVGFLWVRGHKKPKFRPPRSSESASTLPFYSGKLGIDNRGDETERSVDSMEYGGADVETMSYLNSLRERYKDHIIGLEQEIPRPVGFRDVVDDDSDDKKEDKGVITFLRLDDQHVAEAAYGGGLPLLPQHQEAKGPISVCDILNLELNSTDADLDDDLRSIMN
jgi:hypothetical protein